MSEAITKVESFLDVNGNKAFRYFAGETEVGVVGKLVGVNNRSFAWTYIVRPSGDTNWRGFASFKQAANVMFKKANVSTRYEVK